MQNGNIVLYKIVHMFKIITRIALLLYGSILISSGCKRICEQDFFVSQLSVKEISSIGEIHLKESFVTKANVPMSAIVDSLMISIDRSNQSYMYSVSNIHNDTLLGTFCRRGRSRNEVLDCLPIMNTFTNCEGDLCTIVFSFGDGRLFLWNITKSLATSSDVYENIIHLQNDENWFPFFSGYHLNDTSVIVRNSNQHRSCISCEVPRYEVYSINTGELLHHYDVFKPVEFETNNPIYTSRSFFGCTDCVKPDKTKIAIGMGHMPVFAILDLHTGNCNGFRIKDLMRFSPYERIWHFCSLVSDDQFIYALYYGGDISNPTSERHSSTLFVLDWDGQIKSRYVLDRYVTELKLSNGVLYLTHTDDVVHFLQTTDL